MAGYCNKHGQYFGDECPKCSTDSDLDPSILNLIQSIEKYNPINSFTTSLVCTCGMLTDKEKFEELYFRSAKGPTFGQMNCPIHGKR